MSGHMDQAADVVRAAASQLNNGEALAATAAISTAVQEVERYIGIAVAATHSAAQFAMGSGAMQGGRMATGWFQGAHAVEQTGRGMQAHLQEVINDAARMASQIGDIASTMEEDSMVIRNTGTN